MKRPTKLFFMIVLISATVAKAQQPTVKPYDIDLANYQYPYPVLPSKNSALVIAVTFSYRNRFAIRFLHLEILAISFLWEKPFNCRSDPSGNSLYAASKCLCDRFILTM